MLYYISVQSSIITVVNCSVQMFSFVVATDRNGVMGSKDGGLPWGRSQKADLKRFRELTKNQTIIMGRTTFDELPEPLPNRHHVVITHEPKESKEEQVEFMTFEQALEQYGNSNEEMFVIGGARIFELFLPYAAKIYLTVIDANYDGDVVFPVLDEAVWYQQSSEDFNSDNNNLHNYNFSTFKNSVT